MRARNPTDCMHGRFEMDRRMVATPVMTLPMGRRDIADYLGLTVEAVSRAPCELRRNDVVKFPDAAQRAVVILDRQRLAAFDG